MCVNIKSGGFAMKQNIKIGVVCLARTTFDYQEAGRIYARIQSELALIPDTEFYCIPNLVIEVPEAQTAALELAAQALDALVVISGTFHLGHLVLELDKVIQKPILLWGLNELPYNGGKIRLNSVCGVNLNASNLYKSGNRQYTASVSDTIDTNWLDAVRVLRALSASRIGIAGFRAHGFFNLGFDELTLFRETGVLIDHFELADVFQCDTTPDAIAEYTKKVRTLFDVSTLTDEQVARVAGLCARIRSFCTARKLTAMAIRCWPEFAASYGISPCAAMSILQAEGLILGCEGDVEGVLSMVMHRALGAETPFLADLSQVDLAADFALMWHCGVAPCNLWDGSCTRSLDTYFAGGKGVTADFVMKSGEVHILRLDSAQGRYRLFLQNGVGLPMEKLLKGTYVKVKFDKSIREVLDAVIYSGVAHHVSLAYGRYSPVLQTVARLKNWEVIQ